MGSFNKIVLMGNITKDPSIVKLDSGSIKGTMRLAVTEKYTSKGEKCESTCFIDVIAWNKLAEVCGDHLRKGAPILVEGKLRYEEWESEGERKSRHTVTASRIIFIPRGPARRPENEKSDEGSGVETFDMEANGAEGQDVNDANNGNS